MTQQLLKQALASLDNSVDLVYERYIKAVNQNSMHKDMAAELCKLKAITKAHIDACSAIRSELAKPSQEDRKPMPIEERRWAFVHDSDATCEMSFSAGINATETFHGIKVQS